MIVHFKGGPLGGETRAWEDSYCRIIRVPSLVSQPFYCGDPSTFPIIATEEYEFYREHERGHREYRWINPCDGLRRELNAVKTHRDSLVVELCAAIDKIDRLKRLKKVAKLLASLQDLV